MHFCRAAESSLASFGVPAVVDEREVAVGLGERGRDLLHVDQIDDVIGGLVLSVFAEHDAGAHRDVSDQRAGLVEEVVGRPQA